MILLHPTYFPPVSHFVKMSRDTEVLFEKKAHFQKQTYRNRCYFYGANGKQLLTVPVMHTRSDKKLKMEEVRVENHFSWQRQHVKSLQTAYRSSPYFEFYEDELIPLFEKKYRFLIDLNLATIEFAADCLGLSLKTSFTAEYNEYYEEITDVRFLVNAKQKQIEELEKYDQVFADKHGFLSDLSILDLIFNLGPDSISYLERQQLIKVLR